MATLTKTTNRFIVILLAVLLLSACVSTSNRPEAKFDKQKALSSRLQLAINYIQTNNHEAARENLQRAMDIDSRSPEIYDLYALIYEREREFDIAEKNFHKALSLDPGFTRGRNNYGSFLLRRNRAVEACEQFRLGADDLNYPRRAELFYKIGLCELMQSKRAQAREAFLKALGLNVSFAPASLELAEMAYTEQNYAQAKQYLSHYDKFRRGPSPRGLWLGIRLEQIFGNLDARDSKGLALKNLFPDSEENLQYQQWLKNGYSEK